MNKILYLTILVNAMFVTLTFSDEVETVVLVHGFMQSKIHMAPVNYSLQKDGWTTVNWSYPSKDKYIEEHGKDLALQLQKIAEQNPNQPIHFVTHSMGGLVVRSALNQENCPKEAKMGKAVLIATPNQGSSFARKLSGYISVRWALGTKSGRELMLTPEGGFDKLGEFPESVSVLLIAGKYDRKVSISETSLNTPYTRVIHPSCHSLICYSPRVMKETKTFLQN
jgi:pimeloyl-ACP methyl ester carboxylesterase